MIPPRDYCTSRTDLVAERWATRQPIVDPDEKPAEVIDLRERKQVAS